MLRCGLLGEKLGHSYSPAIHAMLGDYEYRLYETPPGEVDAFLRGGRFDGLNVTIPYKKTVLPYCAALSETARDTGSVNTLVRRPDGTLYGDNTDAFGFEYLVGRSGVSPAGKRAVVLGSGGASATVCAVLRRLGAESVAVVSRSGEDNYGNLERHADAQLLVNATPVGMYPKNGASPVDLSLFPRCQGVLDVIYNPARTALLLQAERLGLPRAGGLWMLAAQAVRSSELFTGKGADESAIPRVARALSRSMENIILIGMPGCGKSAAAARLAQATGRTAADSDALVAQRAGMGIPEIFETLGEARFRDMETAALAELGRLSGAVVATGGGSVLRDENYPLLHQNGVILWLLRDAERLETAGRPLSQRTEPSQLLRQRRARYERFADHIIDNNGAIEDTVKAILEVLA